MMTACLSVRAREPTDVPIAFATSFAPMFYTMYAQTINANPIKTMVIGSMTNSSKSRYIFALMYILYRSI